MWFQELSPDFTEVSTALTRYLALCDVKCCSKYIVPLFFLLFVCLAYVCTHIHVCGHVWPVCIHMCVEARGQYWVSIIQSLSILVLETESLLNLELTDLARLVGEQASGNCLSLHQRAEVMDTSWCSAYLHWCWRLKPRSSCLPGKHSTNWPSPQPVLFLYLITECQTPRNLRILRLKIS